MTDLAHIELGTASVAFRANSSVVFVTYHTKLPTSSARVNIWSFQIYGHVAKVNGLRSSDRPAAPRRIHVARTPFQSRVGISDYVRRQ